MSTDGFEDSSGIEFHTEIINSVYDLLCNIRPCLNRYIYLHLYQM